MRVISAILAAAAAVAVQAGSWSVQIPNIGSAGVAITFTAPNTGFLPINDNGIGATVLKTEDGGKHWSHPKNNSMFEDAGLFLGSAAYKDDVMALGIFDVFVTNDNGENWRIVKEGTDAVIAQGAFTAGSEFIAVGEVPTFGNQTEQSGLLSSKDGGRTWQFTNLTDVSSTLPRYGGAAGDTWVISGGSFPGVSAELPKGSRRLNRRVIASGTGKGASGFKFADATMLSAVASDDDAGWSAELLVSKDAGKTWASKYHSEGDFYFNEVSCGSQDNCCAVGEADQGARPGARIWCTADGGEQWTENMFIGNYTYSLTGMEFVTPTEAWASGGIFGDIGPLEALFFHTVDAGKTWQQMRFGGLEGLDVYSMTFPSGDSTSGHAVGLTALQETSELVFQ